MINIIINNIEISDLEHSQKENLIKTAKLLYSNSSPVILDSNQLRLLFSVELDNIKDFMGVSTHNHSIFKRNGSKRDVWVPNFHLREIQKWILNNILDNLSVSEKCFGFVKGRSIVNHAENHIYNQEFWVVTFDIKDFFPSITKCQVESIFKKIGYNNEVSKELATLCCIEEYLVQGFPTSPVISNLLLKNFDELITKFSIEKSINFSRYADDLVFSGVGPSINSDLFIEIYRYIEKNLKEYGFVLNKNKTKIYAHKNPKKVTGIMLTNEGLKIPLKIKKYLSKEIYYCKKFGVEDHLKRTDRIDLANYKGYMFGIAGFIRMVEKETGERFFEELRSLHWG